ncbi:unnamed protein product [Rotaria magnacalcarata]|uniref:Uncharacterized protein n=1 Tax=Rotaria magnacalcarata TaxID=392030 RepID=A0A816HEC3_9BILA|nr:unnamed protein product [Rotaria magnacalcarata]CAF1686204.1 unnamed protein product [Rotaria magnacalcarata]CAF2057491.1 unnamed protein product [Rotaria magnacalcarata]CAF2142666.1 unnamed protein product [Rotaria magnacalcarata]CAF2193428.1 unnamed protein product [Rotaria magnacalcarata]
MAFASASFCSAKSDERKVFQYEKSPFTSVSMSALNYQATDRIRTLSKPRLRKDTTIRDGFSRYESNPKYSGVVPAAIRASCSSRLNELAVPPQRYQTYQYELPLPRRVPDGALKYQATPRVTELATPKKLPGTY